MIRFTDREGSTEVGLNVGDIGTESGGCNEVGIGSDVMANVGTLIL